MRSKCPKCGAVFDHSAFSLGSLVHVGGSKLTKCPACGKTAMMDSNVSDEITWPPEEEK